MTAITVMMHKNVKTVCYVSLLQVRSLRLLYVG